jgi:hypothetical protein
MTGRLSLGALVVVAAGYSQAVAPKDTAADVTGMCSMIDADLQRGDVEHASTLAISLAMMTGLTPGKPAAETGPVGDVREAVAKSCSQIAAAYAAKDTVKTQQAAINLRQQLAKAVAALPSTPQAKFARLEATVAQLSGLDRFYRLVDLARAAFDAGDAKATVYANELLNVAPQYSTDWNYGNAIYYGNWVLGRVALQQGNTAAAGQYLLSAGATPGSPQLHSFGPNMMLAQELIQKGQTAEVLQFFKLCANFWKMDGGKLDEWAALVKAGKMPEFGINLRS